MKKKKVILILMFFLSIIVFGVIIYCDYNNIITKLGLSVSFWSSIVAGAFPIMLTIYLWKKEEKERIVQIEEESKLQKKLIVRTAYIDYFESLLEQINEYIIFLKCFVINDKDILGEKWELDKKIESLITAVYLQKNKLWEFNYRVYAFKSIEIDIFKYMYKDEEINLKAYMPYIILKNKFNEIYKGEALSIGIYGDGMKKLSSNDVKKIASDLIDSRDEIEQFVTFLNMFQKDIEERIVF